MIEKESAALPVAQSVTFAALDANTAHYMFKYVYIEGLKIITYSGSNALLSDGTNTIILNITLNQTDFPVNTKVNVKAVVSYTDLIFLTGVASDVSKAPVIGVDPASYPANRRKFIASHTNK